MKIQLFLGALLMGTAVLFTACGTSAAADETADTPQTSGAPETTVAVTEAPKTITVACVGDSITEGVGSSNAATKSYPAQLAKLLGDGYKVINCGKSKATAMDGSSKYWNTNGVAYSTTAEYKKALNAKADVYLVMLGTNDAKNLSARATEGIADYKAAMNRLFDDIQAANPNAEIIVAASPYRFEDATKMRNQEAVIYPTQKALAEARNYRFLDLYGYTKEIVTGGKTINSDKLHFTDEGYAVLAAFFCDALTK